MPSDIRIIHAQEFLQASPDGELDLEQTKRVLFEIALASAPSNDYDIIVDTRGGHLDMDVSDLGLAAELHRYRKALSGKVAVLSPRAIRLRRVLRTLRPRKGLRGQCVHASGDAMEWLTGSWPGENR